MHLKNLKYLLLAVVLLAASPNTALSSFTPVRESEVTPVTENHMEIGDVVSNEWLASMRANLSSATPDWWDGSTQADSRYGEALASAGDFNGDGYDDLIVGARFYPTSSTYRSGRAWLYYGSASGLSSTPDLTFDPPQLKVNGFFGYSVGTAGDVNDDNVDDIIIGMVNWSGLFADEGAAFVYYGSDLPAGPDTTFDWFAHSNNQKWASMGSSVSTAGDVNGDDVDDIIVGAYRYNSSGAAFVWHGSPHPTGLGATGTPANADWKVISTQGNNEMTTTSTAGDVDGDGYDDIIIGAPYYDKPQTDEGLVMVWLGDPLGLNLGVDGTMSNAAWTAEGNANNRRLGVSIGTVGDVNGDTYDDVILGSLYSLVVDGDALVFNGSFTGLGPPTNATPADADWKVKDPAGGDNRNFSVQSNPGADVNGDGYDDAIIGINGYDVISGTETLTNTGAVAVWYGSASGLGGDETVTSADWLAEGSQIGEYMGQYVNTPGDVDNNGAADVAAGAPYYDINPDTAGVNYGRAYAYYFNPIPAITSLNPASTTAGGSDFTLTVNGTGFVNGSTVRWDGSNRTTIFVSKTQLTASISAADIASAGTAGVTVFNKSPAGGTSNTVTFTINNPLPSITSINPASATAGGAAFTLTVNGAGFMNPASTVRWNGSDRPTTYVSGTKLEASIGAADCAVPGTAAVSVLNSGPGGGPSNDKPFTINKPIALDEITLPLVLKSK